MGLLYFGISVYGSSIKEGGFFSGIYDNKQKEKETREYMGLPVLPSVYSGFYFFCLHTDVY